MAMGNCDIFQELGDKCSYYLISIYKANIISKPHIRVRLSILSKFFCTFYILAGMRGVWCLLYIGKQAVWYIHSNKK